MQDIFQIASNVSTPLALGGFVTAVLFFIFRQILKKDIFPSFTKTASAEVIKIVVDRLFILALISMVLGFAGFVISNRINASPSTDKINSLDKLELSASVFGKNENNKTKILKDDKEALEKNAYLFSSTKSSVRILTVHGASWLKSQIIRPDFEKALKVASVELLVIDPLSDSYKYLAMSNKVGFEREYSFSINQLRIKDLRTDFDYYREIFANHESSTIKYYSGFPWIRFTIYDDTDATFVLTPFLKSGTESTKFHTTDPWVINCLEKIFEEFKTNSRSLKTNEEYTSMWDKLNKYVTQ